MSDIECTTNSPANCRFGQNYRRNPLENFIFCVMLFLNTTDNSNYCLDKTWRDNLERRIKGGNWIRKEWFELSMQKSKYLYTFRRDEDDEF